MTRDPHICSSEYVNLIFYVLNFDFFLWIYHWKSEKLVDQVKGDGAGMRAGVVALYSAQKSMGGVQRGQTAGPYRVGMNPNYR